MYLEGDSCKGNHIEHKIIRMNKHMTSNIQVRNYIPKPLPIILNIAAQWHR